ncbi:FumA C-terminus/TtdB family hydratase beta subunit [Aminobacterium colombiense]|uniref:Hydro-lyase, Fe-S type, tartrate/fumarate subfamily, beta subunit n=1 Tax=Aminobacterium colombiense (strain DSM 12261 / ALA-1) TaxID=572547 RepID=D5ECK0_AMICL|nr:FumA C-terminus/TtdB family hydratase beta subunit [Aminobacterium colombiense]ADE56282.1 hydro-lyase, Fe-S type, tartrate/fumarate subfamily, beta subunit [Aminobacterium colombiense DSM 12261]
MAEKLLTVPLKEEEVRELKAGDVVYLKGPIFTSRDMGHINIKQLLEKNEKLPVDFNGSAIFHAGPVVNKKEDGTYELVVIGPTTSIRMEPYYKMVADLGVRAIIGKGGLAEDSLRQFAETGQVYLQAAPGCAVVLAEGISKIKEVHWLELGVPEALWVLDAHKFGPLVVGMDSHGTSVYKELREKAETRNKELYG